MLTACSSGEQIWKMRNLQEKKTKPNQSSRESIYTWMWYSSLNAKFFTSSVVLGRPQTFLFNINIWCLTWKILRKQWFHTFSVTYIQTESKYSGQKEFNSVTLIPSIKSIILEHVTGNRAIKSMQHISKTIKCWQMPLLEQSACSIWYAN